MRENDVEPDSLLAGAAEIDITPDKPVELAGFAARSGVSQGVDRPLYLRAYWITTRRSSAPDQSVLIVIGDIIKWPSDRSDETRQQLSDKWKIPPDHIVLSATHTHSGPQTFSNPTATADDEWVSFLYEQLFKVVEEAWNNRQPATMSIGRGTSQIGLNRRWLRGDESGTPEYPEGLIDRELTLLRISAMDDHPIGILAHYACHPTIASGMMVSSEYPGVMSDIISHRLGNGAVVGLLQGCAGDINAHITRDRGLRQLGNEDVQRIGEEFAEDVWNVLIGPMNTIEVDYISAQVATANLTFQRVPSVRELEENANRDDILGIHARRLLAEPERLVSGIPMELCHVRLGSDLGFLTMPGEVTTPYGLFVKSESNGKTLPLAYSNGMIGYIVTSAQLTEGGYEAIESTRYAGLPSPFAPEIEEELKSTISKVLR